MLDLPTFDQAFPTSAAAGAPAPAAVAPQGGGNAFVSGFKSGLYGTGAALAGAYQGAAKIVGADGLADRYGQTAAGLQASAAAAGRPDLDQQGFLGHGLGGFLSKAAYTAGQAVPQLVGAGAAGVAATAALPEEAALAGGSLIGRIGASLPKFLGGSGVGAGFAADVAPEALVAGAKTAAAIGGAGGVMGVQSAGEQVNAAAEQPGGLTRGAAARAFAQGIPIGLVQGLVPGEGAALARGGEAAATGLRSSLLGTVADHSLKNAAAGAVGAGLQAAADTSFDPNMSAGDRAAAIVHAAAGGAEAGGLLGAGFGMFAKRSIPDQMAAVDQQLGAAGAAPAPSGDTPPSPAPPAPQPVQQELPLSPPISSQASDFQSSLFDRAPYDPGKTVPRAQRDDKSVMAEIQAAIAAREAAKPAEPAPVSEPAAPSIKDAVAAQEASDAPQNGFLKDMLKAAKVNVGRGKGDFPEFVAGSTATNEAELHNELHNVDPNSSLAQDPRFLKMADLFGVGDPTLDAQLQRVLQNPTPDEAQAKALFFKVGVRDAAAKLRLPEAAQEPARPSEAELASPAAPAASEPAAGAQEQPPARPAVPVQAPTLTADVPGLDRAPEPAVKPPVEAGVITQDDLQRQMAELLQSHGASGGDTATAQPEVDTTSQETIPPKAITDRVLDAARSAVGDKGGEVSIADLRKALPDVAPKDFDNALREIHGDDSDTALTQAPKGQRTGVDGVSVPGQGRFHNLELEAREPQDAGVQERSAAPEAAADQPGSGAADGGGDAGGGEAARASEAEGAAEGQPGTPPVPGPEAQAPVAPRPQFDRPAGLPKDTPYPGDAAKAAELGVALPMRTDANGQAYDAVVQRLRGLHNMQVDNAQGSYRFAQGLRDARSTFGKVADPAAQLQSLDPARYQATRDAVAPRDAAPVVDPAQQAAAEKIIAAPEPAKAGVQRALRSRTKVATSILRTPEGDQVPTAAVGGQVTELPQAAASVPDTLTTPVAKGSEGGTSQGELFKLPQDRMPGVSPTILPRDQVQAHFDRFVSKLSPDVQGRVHLLGASDPIPGRAEPMGSGTLGLYRGGDVYLNADAMSSRADIEDTLSHEVFGHLGTQADLGGLGGQFDEGRYQRRMLDVFNRAGGRDGIEKLARQNGVWKVGDDGNKLNGGAGLSAYFPADGAALTPHTAARIVDELIAHRAALTPSSLDRTVQSVQGLVRRALVGVMRRAGMTEFARRMDRFGQPELSRWVDQTRAALTEQPKPGQVDLMAGATTPRHFVQGAQPLGEAPFMAKLGAVQRDSEGVMGAVDALRNHITKNAVYRDLFGEKFGSEGPGTRERLRDAGRTMLENLVPGNGIAEEGSRTGMHGMLEHFHLGEMDRAIRTRLDGVGNRVAQDHLDLRMADAARSRMLDRVMDVATSNNLDPRRPFADHAWLREDRSPDQVEALRSVHAQLQKDYNALGQPMKNGRPSTAQQVYNDHVALSQMNWYMARAMHTYDSLRTVFGAQVDPGYEPSRRFAGLDDSFRDATGRQLAEDHFGDVGKARDFWRSEFGRLNGVAERHLTSEGTREGNSGTRTFQDLDALVTNNKGGEKGYVQQGPYFRRGRTGDYAVGFKLPAALDENGEPTERPDTQALRAVQQGYAKDFPQVSIGASDTNRQVFARFQSEELARNFAAKVLRGGELRRHVDLKDGEPRVSLLAHAKETESAVPFLQAHLDAARARFDAEVAKLPDGEEKTALAVQRDKYVGTIRSTIMDLSGDTSMRSVQSRRENVQGSNADMLENQKAAAATFARAVSTISTRAEKADALFQARQAIEAAGRSGSKDAVAKSARMQRIYNAYEDRNTAADVRVDNTLLSHVKSGLHTYTLGASPAYIIMNMSQLGTLALPEFAKFHGHASSIAAMTGALGKTGRVLAAMVRTGGIVNGGITKAVLDKSGLSTSERNFLSTLVNHDHIELGSYSAANSGLGVGNLGRVGRYAHYANSTALLAETAGRLVTAFAAKKLHEGLPAGAKRDSLMRQFPTAEDYAGHVVGESMLRWGSYNTPKLFTAGGALGKLGPVVTQFHGFVPRLVEKIYRESMDGFTARLGTGPEAVQQRAEARRFVMTHLAAVTAMSGALGLPMAGYAAGAATRLSGLFYDQPYDFEAHIRGFLADTFGKDIGEVLSRGLPRYLGVDMSELGDEGWGPLGRIMEDRRKLEDAVPDYLAHAWGSAPSAAMNIALGAREMLEGRWSEAGARMLPTAMRNLVRAYRVSDMGYVNSVGEKLPVSAGAAEVLKTALGLEGGDVAEERERQEAVSGLKADRAYRSDKIKRDASIAASQGDQAGLSQTMDAARQFDQDNPGMTLSRQIRGDIVKKARATAYGAQTGTLGIDPRDSLARSLANY